MTEQIDDLHSRMASAQPESFFAKALVEALHQPLKFFLLEQRTPVVTQVTYYLICGDTGLSLQI